jgi:segregation and condensation protein B
MDLEVIEASIEAILFTMGESVEAARIATAIGQDEETTRKIIHNMMDKYNDTSRGIKIIELEDSFQMCTKAEYYETLIKVASQPKKYVLTDALLETLSIVAYKQPVTKLEIEKIRGVNSDHAVSRLVEYGLVQEVGRLDAPGRPMLLGTTEDFLRTFGVQSLEELPVISQEMIDGFKQEAELEVAGDAEDEQIDGQMSLDIDI